jgi:hypothetical protein
LHLPADIAEKAVVYEERKGLEGQPKGLASRNPAKPDFRHEGPEMRQNT